MKFFKKQQNSGFTLVELIVVIAILAILAGVGAVAYSGYIEYTKKGVDRKTVGEIIHALELANYSDPNLITGYIEVYFTSENGIKVPLDLDGRIAHSLEDAFGAGALPSTKPSYDGWKDQSFLGVDSLKSFFTGEGITTKELETFNTYKDATANGGAASFSGNITELWGTLHNLIEKSVSGGIAIPGVDAADKGGLMKKAIDFAITNPEEYGTSTEDLINTWANGGEYVTTNENGAAQFSVVFANNMAFVSYARQQNLSEEQKKALDEYAKTTNAELLVQSYKTSSILKNKGFDNIFEQYVSSGQAKSDASGYFLLMEISSGIDFSNDKDFFEKTDKYSGMLGSMLGNPSLMEKMDDSDFLSGGNTDVSGTGIRIGVQNVNGVLNFSVDPSDADPGGRSGSVLSTGDENSKLNSFTKDDVTTSVTIDLNAGTLTATSTGGSSTENNVIMGTNTKLNINKSAITVPDGWSVIKISCLGVSRTPNDGKHATVSVPVGGNFTLSLGANTDTSDSSKFNNFAVIMSVKGSQNEKSTTSITIVFDMKDDSGTTRSVSVPVNLFYIGLNG